jgi:pimeloyl-ACP methyl ester carboxylesterase
METLTLEASGLTFDAVADGPADGRLVLLLHGFPQTSREWAGVMHALAAAGCRAVAPDQRGYSPGARPPDVGDYAMDALVGDTLGMLDRLGAERADVVGHDWGAAVAWHVADRHPERVRSLTAVSVPHPIAFTGALADDADQQQRSAYMQFFRQEEGIAENAITAGDWKALRESIYDGVVAPDDVEHYVERFSQPGALTAALNWYRAASPGDFEGLTGVTVPTLFVWGPDDPAIGRVAAEACDRHVSGPFRFVELEGAGHWIPDSHADRLAQEIVEHLERT